MVDRVPARGSAPVAWIAEGGAARKGRPRNALRPIEPMLAALERADPENADELRRKADEADSLIQQVKGAYDDANEQRKANAWAKIERIKAELKMLRLLAAVNPKAAARRAAQLSRELAAAVKEYNLAGGTGAGGNVTASALTLAPAQGAQAGGDGTSGAADGSSVAIPSAADVQPTLAGDASGGAIADNGAANGDDNGDDGGNDKTRKAFQAHYDARQKSFDAAHADREFARAVEEIKNALKRILELVRKKLREKDDSSADQAIRDGERALNAVEGNPVDVAPAVPTASLSVSV